MPPGRNESANARQKPEREMTRQMTGAKMVVQALKDQEVDAEGFDGDGCRVAWCSGQGRGGQPPAGEAGGEGAEVSAGEPPGVERLRRAGRECVAAGDFEGAEEAYTRVLEAFEALPGGGGARRERRRTATGRTAG